MLIESVQSLQKNNITFQVMITLVTYAATYLQRKNLLTIPKHKQTCTQMCTRAIMFTHAYVYISPERAQEYINPDHHRHHPREIEHFEHVMIVTHSPPFYLYLFCLQHLMHINVIVAEEYKTQKLSFSFVQLELCVECIQFLTLFSLIPSISIRVPNSIFQSCSIADLFWGERFDLHIISLLRCTIQCAIGICQSYFCSSCVPILSNIPTMCIQNQCII